MLRVRAGAADDSPPDALNLSVAAADLAAVPSASTTGDLARVLPRRVEGLGVRDPARPPHATGRAGARRHRLDPHLEDVLVPVEASVALDGKTLAGAAVGTGLSRGHRAVSGATLGQIPSWPPRLLRFDPGWSAARRAPEGGQQRTHTGGSQLMTYVLWSWPRSCPSRRRLKTSSSSGRTHRGRTPSEWGHTYLQICAPASVLTSCSHSILYRWERSRARNHSLVPYAHGPHSLGTASVRPPRTPTTSGINLENRGSGSRPYLNVLRGRPSPRLLQTPVRGSGFTARPLSCFHGGKSDGMRAAECPSENQGERRRRHARH